MWRTSQPVVPEAVHNNNHSNRKSKEMSDHQNTKNESSESSIEAVWLVKSSSTTTTTTTTSIEKKGGPLPTTTKQTKTTTTAAHRFRKILAALSFEESQTTTENNSPHKTKSSSEKKRFFQRRRKNKKKTMTTTTTVQNNIHNVIRVETFADGGNANTSSDEIYFDALQFGDATDNQDEFQTKAKPRESIVLSGITIRSSQLLLHPTNIETVLDGGNNSQYFSDDGGGGDDDDDDATSSPSSEDDTEDHNITDTEEDRPLAVTPPLRPARGPPPPEELPLRFLRAGKNDPIEGLRRYESTLKMRAEQHLDTILREPNMEFDAIKKYYPHYCHCKGKQGEPCFYEQPPRTNLKALQQVGVNVDKLMRHYTMVTEYQWQYLDRDDLSKSIYIIDLAGIRISDFAGEAVEFLKKASKFSAEHYPERAGYVFVINVPAWFKIIWTVVKPIIDESTLKKIYILRGKDEIRQNMLERIPLENIPPEYGGTSMPLGESPEEKTLAEWMEHNNALARAGQTACTVGTTCRFCDWTPARSY